MTAPPSPQVSVVIPTRNRWEFLRRTLASALGQQDVDHEVIVVDDESRDGTSKGLSKLDDSRLRVIRRQRSTGVASARNCGLAEARGAWVAYLDDDDLWSPGKLRAQLDAAASSNAKFAYAGVVYLDELKRVTEIGPAPDPSELRAQLLVTNAIPATCSNLIVQTDVMRELGGFDESLFHFADWDLGLRLAEGCRGAACRELLIAYVRHSRSMLTVSDKDPFEELDHLISKQGSNGRESFGAQVDRVGVARWIALAHRRAGRRVPAARAYLRGATKYRDLGIAVEAAAVFLRPSARLPYSALPHPPWLDSYRDIPALSR